MRWPLWWDSPERPAVHRLPGRPEPCGLLWGIDFLLLLLLISAPLVPLSGHCWGC